jgi:hypothetical protein
MGKNRRDKVRLPARIWSRDKTRDLTSVFGFFALLRVAVRDEIAAAPEITVVFDGELGSAARRASDPAYKAHRPGGEAALAPIKTGQRILDNMATAIRCRDLARMRTDVPVSHVPDGQPSPSLPAPADVVKLLNLW